MRTGFAAIFLCVVWTSCSNGKVFNPPPFDQLYFPTGIVHTDLPSSTDGVLFVANANFDRRYTSGSVSAISLSKIEGLPALGQHQGGAALSLKRLSIETESVVQVPDFTGEMAGVWLAENRFRLYVPSRSEGMALSGIDVAFSTDGSPPILSCQGQAADRRDCTTAALSLTPTQFVDSDDGVPRAPMPFGVVATARACTASSDCGEGRSCQDNQCVTSNNNILSDVYVTHLTSADSPLNSGKNFRSYLVHLDTESQLVDEQSFIDMGFGGASSVVTGQRWTYAAGRFAGGGVNLLRLIDRSRTVLTSGLESVYRVADARGIAIGGGEKRLFVAGRAPDSLLVVGVTGHTSDAPQLSLIRAIALPNAPTQVRSIVRPGRGDLVVVVCTGGGVVVIYDDDVGDVVAQIPGVGLQPFGLAIDERGSSARIFVSNFSDGRIAVIDLADVYRPQDAQLVAQLGRQQLCLTRGTSGGLDCETASGDAL